jgi:hypothetical protein
MSESARNPRSIAPLLIVGLLAVAAGTAAALLVPRQPGTATAATASTAERAAEPSQCTSEASGPRRRERARVAPPSFVTPPPSGVQLDPRAANYDALALGPLVTGGLRNVFDGEPRDEAWAAPVEKGLGAALSKDAGGIPGVSGIEVECRTTMCRVTWSAPAESQLKIQDLVRVLYGGAGFATRSGEVTIAYAGGDSPRYHDLKGRPDGVLADLQARRQESLPILRAGTADPNQYLHLKPQEWPEP